MLENTCFYHKFFLFFLTTGGSAEQSGQFQVNDEILDVNGEDLTGMRHSEAWNHLKFLPSGEITMTIRRFSSKEEDLS